MEGFCSSSPLEGEVYDPSWTGRRVRGRKKRILNEL
jgi:hypothetical protein